LKPIFRISLTAVAGLALAATQLVQPPVVSLPTNPARANSISVEPLPLTISCPGSWVEVAGEAGTDIGLVERIGQAAVSSYVGAGELETAPEILFQQSQHLSVSGPNQSTELLSALQAQLVDRQRASGLAAASCAQPTTSGWFVSGQAGVGKESVLILANPNAVDTQVLIEYHLPGGVTNERVAIAAGEERLASLAVSANLESTFALRIESLGAPVSVAVQNRYSRGLTPLGVNLSTKLSQPATEQWLLPITALAEGYEQPTLRIYNPGSETEIIATIFGTAGVEVIREFVASESFAEVAISIQGEASAIQVQSEEPVLAGVLNPSLDPLDRSWILPADSFTQVRIPLSVYDSSLFVNNPNATAITITVLVEDGVYQNYQTLELAPFTMESFPLSGDSVRIESASLFQAALQILDQGYAVILPSENQNLGDEIEVLVR
jgi:hypothetical protein